MSRVIRLRLSPWMVQLVSAVIEQLPKHPSKAICLPTELLPQDDAILREAWEQSLLDQLAADYTHLNRTLSRLRSNGVADLNSEQTESFLRVVSSVRLWLQRERLDRIPAADLQSDSINIDTLPEESQPAYACYLLLADIQEQIIEQLLQNDRDGDSNSPPAEVDFQQLEEQSDASASGYDSNGKEYGDGSADRSDKNSAEKTDADSRDVGDADTDDTDDNSHTDDSGDADDNNSGSNDSGDKL